jgi:hypothetical protein
LVISLAGLIQMRQITVWWPFWPCRWPAARALRRSIDFSKKNRPKRRLGSLKQNLREKMMFSHVLYRKLAI